MNMTEQGKQDYTRFLNCPHFMGIPRNIKPEDAVKLFLDSEAKGRAAWIKAFKEEQSK